MASDGTQDAARRDAAGSAGSAGPDATAAPAMGRMLVFSIVVGVLAAAAASLLMELIDAGQELAFQELPQALGMDEAPLWWSVLMLLIAAVGVLGARALPGATGEGPLTGFHFSNPLSSVPSILLAALFTLCFGMVLGPEAPLIVLGTAVGAILTRRSQDPRMRQAAMMLGGVAAIGAIFGNPFITGFMILEFAAIGMAPAVLIVPVFVALGAGYLTQVGIFGLPGFGVHSLSVPGLPEYSTILPGDLVFGLVVALVAAIVAVLARETAVVVSRTAARRPAPTVVGAAIVTALVLVVAVAGFGIEQDLILFSGESGMPALLAEGSVVAVLVILVGKAIAYAAALGGGYRGGPIFPATFLGVAAAVLVTLLIPHASISPMAAAGIAAAAAAMLRLPATSALLGALLVAGGGAAVAPFAIMGAIVGLLIRIAADRRMGLPTSPPAPVAHPSADSLP